MSAGADQSFAPPAGKYLVDPYDDWARGEGAPIHAGAALDMLAVETAPWARFGMDGAFCHLDGRDDFLAVFVFELAAGGASAPMRHLYEEVFYVLSGHGTAEIDLPGGQKTSVEWGPKTLFAAPMNASIRLRNTSGASARLASVNDARYLMSLYRNERFLFDNPLAFPERADGAYARDCATVGAGPQTLANGSIGADLFELAAGAHGRAERQMFGALMLGVDGAGAVLSWGEDAGDIARTPWRHGIAFAPQGMMFHQQFNVGGGPARYLGLALGSAAAPMFRPRRRAYGDAGVYASGSAIIEPGDQDIAKLSALAKR